MSKCRQIVYHVLAGLILSGSVALLFLVPGYRMALSRLGANTESLLRSQWYLGCDLIGLDFVPSQTLNDPVAAEVATFVGLDFEAFFARLGELWGAMWNAKHFALYGLKCLINFVDVLYYGCYALVFGIILYIPILVFSDETNNDHGKDTKPLALFKRIVANPVSRAYVNARDFVTWWVGSAWRGWTVLVVTLALNVWTLLFGFLAWYFYFVITVDFSTLPLQLVKLYYDVMLALRGLPWPMLVPLCLWLFLRWRKARGMRILQHTERMNCGLQNEAPMCIFFTAPPRTGKTTMITSMALTFAAEFRRAALELMEKNMLRFPRFPWIVFEKDLQEEIREHRVYNLATVREWVRECAALFEECPAPCSVWGYELSRYDVEYDDNLWIKDLFEVLESYAQEYFIYFLETSLMIGNFSVREDFIIDDIGNFPLVDTDFFSRDPREAAELTQYAHVLDFDMCRLGRKMIKDNAHIGGLEFGVVLISEVDKERKNDLRLQETKAKADECNQKNDLFNEWLKMAGHAASVDGYCFLRVLTDAQRPSSWGADARELSTVMHVCKRGDPLNALALFWIEDAVIGKYLGWYMEKYREERYRRGDNTLLGWLGTGLAGALAGYRERRVNLYGYRTQKLELEAGTLEGSVEEKKYFIANKKVYSRRFATDCFKAISETQAERCQTGMNDFSQYDDIYPSFEKLEEQNSHFQKDVFRYFEISSVVTSAPEILPNGTPFRVTVQDGTGT